MHGQMHACTGAGHSFAHACPKGQNPPDKWITRLRPVPLVWRRLSARRRSTTGEVSCRYEGDSSPEVGHQAQTGRPFGLETRFPPRWLRFWQFFRRRSQVPPAGAYDLHANRASNKNAEVRRNQGQVLQNACTRVQAHPRRTHAYNERGCMHA